MNNEVDSIAVSGAAVYAGGKFTSVNGSTPRNHLAGFDPTNGVATAFDPNVNGDVNAVAVSGTTVYAGGAFSDVNNGTSRFGAAAFDTGGGSGDLRGQPAADAGTPPPGTRTCREP